MKRIRTIFVFALLAVAAVLVVGSGNSDVDKTVVMRDDCDPDDPLWIPTGGCFRKQGDVTNAEFFEEANSPLSTAVVGHQAWRNDPSYVQIRSGETLQVFNRGGRIHTFTEVDEFGGGRIPPLNQGLAPAPKCAGAVNVPAGGKSTVEGLAPGNHRFQCCLHPWMRAVVKVEPAAN